MEDFYNSRHVATLYGITLETVRAWSEEFVDYLSPTANPGRNRQRLFSDEDMAVFALVAEMKGQGKTFSDVHVSLKSGQRGRMPEMVPEQIQAIVVNEQEKRLSLEVEYLQRMLMKVQDERDEALAQAEAARGIREENIRLEAQLKYAEERIAELLERFNSIQEQSDKKIHELTNERAKLEREIGEAQGELKAVMRMMKTRSDSSEAE